MSDLNRPEAFLGRLRRALGREPGAAIAFEDVFPDDRDAARRERAAAANGRGRQARLALLARLKEAAVPLNLAVTAVPDAAAAGAAVADLVRRADTEWGEEKAVVGWDHPLVAALDLGRRLRPQGIAVDIPGPDSDGTPSFGARAATAFVGVTAADYCVADTATLAMITRPGQPRTVSLVPAIHVAVIRLEQIVADVSELYALLDPATTGAEDGLGRCMTFISGPSKTADIELVMVHGAHGPRALHLYVITE